MATTWELIQACFADARTAEELLSDLAFRRELRLDPHNVLSTFVLGKVLIPAPVVARIDERRIAR